MSAVSPEAKAKRRAYITAWYAANREKRREQSRQNYLRNRDAYLARSAQHQRPNRYKRLYGITVEDYDAMLEAQNGGCGICENALKDRSGHRKYFAVDHCHVTGAVRGLLCTACNVLLGQYEKKREGIARYLARGSGGRNQA